MCTLRLPVTLPTFQDFNPRRGGGGSLDGPAPGYYADNNNVDNMKPCHTIQKSLNFYLWWALPSGDLNLDLSENSIEMVS